MVWDMWAHDGEEKDLWGQVGAGKGETWAPSTATPGSSFKGRENAAAPS